MDRRTAQYPGVLETLHNDTRASDGKTSQFPLHTMRSLTQFTLSQFSGRDKRLQDESIKTIFEARILNMDVRGEPAIPEDWVDRVSFTGLLECLLVRLVKNKPVLVHFLFVLRLAGRQDNPLVDEFCLGACMAIGESRA